MKSRMLVLLFVCLAVSGCVRIDIGDSLPTIGEELIQLDQAQELGAITDEEFRRMRVALLSRL